jgi:transposase
MQKWEINDDQWEKIRKFLPGPMSYVGTLEINRRLNVEAVLWVFLNKRSWRKLPIKYGKWYSVYQRYRRWELDGVWQEVFPMFGVK